MRQTLRRSCAACARSKLSCDLRTPCCTRCTKRKLHPCVYANEPWTASPRTARERRKSASPHGVKPGDSSASTGSPADGSVALIEHNFGSLDPFESYPQTRLPREHVHRLIHSFLNKIAFQYYPLDLNATSNPFLISWWPLALGDPALFHVSLQTASLDEELSAQKGFEASQILMTDSVGLLRRKVEVTSLAVQDGTMNSIITLAAIEFGMGNVKTANMHVDGVRGLVRLRGGINSVRQTSPLTARMVSWVSMLVTGHPQFETQDDMGRGDGIPPIPEWQLDVLNSSYLHDEISELASCEVQNVLVRLRNVFQRAERTPLPTTRLHDLTCFAIHRLLGLSDAKAACSEFSSASECLRYAIVLYMFIIHGPTYYSHAVIMRTLVGRLVEFVPQLELTPQVSDSLKVWLLAVGNVASIGTPHVQFFRTRGRNIATRLQLSDWSDVLSRLKSVLWFETQQAECRFRRLWDDLRSASEVAIGSASDSMSAGPPSEIGVLL